MNVSQEGMARIEESRSKTALLGSYSLIKLLTGDTENVGPTPCADGCDIYCVAAKYIWIALIFLQSLLSSFGHN